MHPHLLGQGHHLRQQHRRDRARRVHPVRQLLRGLPPEGQAGPKRRAPRQGGHRRRQACGVQPGPVLHRGFPYPFPRCDGRRPQAPGICRGAGNRRGRADGQRRIRAHHARGQAARAHLQLLPLHQHAHPEVLSHNASPSGQGAHPHAGALQGHQGAEPGGVYGVHRPVHRQKGRGGRQPLYRYRPHL